MAHLNLMWWFSSVDNPDLYSTENLTKEEVEAHILGVMTRVTSDFMGDGGPLPLNKARSSDLVSPFLAFPFLWTVY